MRNLFVQFVEPFGSIVIPPFLTATKDVLTEISNCTVPLPDKDITNLDNIDFDVKELNKTLRLYSILGTHLTILAQIYSRNTNAPGRPSGPHTALFSQPENLEVLTSVGDVLR